MLAELLVPIIAILMTFGLPMYWVKRRYDLREAERSASWTGGSEAKELEGLRQERKLLAERIENLESIVCSVDYELNTRLARLASEQARLESGMMPLVAQRQPDRFGPRPLSDSERLEHGGSGGSRQRVRQGGVAVRWALVGADDRQRRAGGQHRPRSSPRGRPPRPARAGDRRAADRPGARQPLPHRPPDRPRRHGRGLPGPRRGARRAGRAQGGVVGAELRSDRERGSLPPRGLGRAQGHVAQRHPHPRPGPDPQRPALHLDGVLRRPHAGRRDADPRPAAAGRAARHPRPGLRRAGAPRTTPASSTAISSRTTSWSASAAP